MHSSGRLRLILRVLVPVLVILLVVSGGVGWYYSDQLLRVTHAGDPFGTKVIAVSATSVTFARTHETERDGTYGITWPGGHAQLGRVEEAVGGRVTRALAQVKGSLQPGDKVRIDTDPVLGDPSAMGLAFRNVLVPDELGNMPAWRLGGNGPVWVLVVHGRGGSRQEALRVLPTLVASGMPVLDVSYRNDIGAPSSPDQLYHLGDTEWRDVAAAIAYAKGQGAHGVVLYGWSMGGAIVETTVRRASVAGLVRGVVLDSPVVDWRATLHLQGARRGLPSLLTDVAEQVVEWRIGINLGSFDQRRVRVSLPTLLFAADDDRTVPIGPTDQWALANRENVTYVRVHGAGHTEEFNVDPATYTRSLADFLRRVSRS